MVASVPKVLVIGFGNPGRLDDGLGTALASALECKGLPGVTVEADYQLNVEHAALAAQHDVVVFADADVSCEPPFRFERLEPVAELSFSSHSLSPAAVLGVARTLLGATTEGYVLGIRGYEFNEFGERLTPEAVQNLGEAVEFLVRAIDARDFREVSRAAPANLPLGSLYEEDEAVQDGKHVILCVDDDPDILENLRLIIESHGHVAVPAATAEEGLRKYRESDPDLIIADLMMEEVDAGTHLLRELKAEGNTKPVYILSSVGDMLHAQADDVAIGATGVLQKPLSIDALGRILKEKLVG